MKNVRQKKFIEKWYQRAFETHDQFDTFFCLWVALAVAAQNFTRGNSDYETDGKKIRAYFLAHSDKVLSSLNEHNDKMVQFAMRKGSQYRTPMLDAGDRLRPIFSQLSAHYLGTQRLTDEDVVCYTAELFNKVRNNVFHGGKMYDEQADIAVLEIVNPILDTILQTCENIFPE